RKLAETLMNEPEQISLAIYKPAEGINQQVYMIHDDQKVALLTELLKSATYNRIIVFAGRKEKVKELGKVFKKLGLKAAAFHSDLEQKEREALMLDFKNDK